MLFWDFYSSLRAKNQSLLAKKLLRNFLLQGPCVFGVHVMSQVTRGSKEAGCVACTLKGAMLT